MCGTTDVHRSASSEAACRGCTKRGPCQARLDRMSAALRVDHGFKFQPASGDRVADHREAWK